jgi:flavodoxin
MEGIGAEAVDEYELIVIVSSTYGQGDIPDDASSGTLAEDKAGAWAAGWPSLLKKAA